MKITTKADAIALFSTRAALARAVGLSRARISQWPDELTQRQADLVRGAALRMGMISHGSGRPAVAELALKIKALLRDAGG